ncbi:MAG: hypothetical protein RIC56_03040 [Pseudomonadales bacterium]
MASTTQRDYHSSANRIAARAQLRRIANEASRISGRDAQAVLGALVLSQLRDQYDPRALATATEFEIGLHHMDVVREVTAEVMAILEA